MDMSNAEGQLYNMSSARDGHGAEDHNRDTGLVDVSILHSSEWRIAVSRVEGPLRSIRSIRT